MSRLIAITGATGFAGGHAVSALLGRGYRLRALVRAPARAKLPAAVERIEGDLDQADALGRLAEGADTIVHLAGAISALTAREFHRVNGRGTVAVAEAARHAGVARFIHVSSLSAREPALSDYGASKRAGEDAVAALVEPLNAVILRPPAVYGAGDRATLPLIRELTRPVAVIPGHPDARFSLIHVADLGRIIADCVENGIRGLHEISDGTAGGYGWPDLLRIAEARLGGRIRAVYLPRAVPAAVAVAAGWISQATGKPGMISSGKIAELYHRDWVTRGSPLDRADSIRFAAGFTETLKWYRDAGWLPPARRGDTSGP